MLVVMAGQRCAGFLIRRGKSGVEAFTGAERSLGLFPTEHDAAAAINATTGAP